ncbi:hypothetical protein Bca4012_092391 [Brassica carinata]
MGLQAIVFSQFTSFLDLINYTLGKDKRRGLETVVTPLADKSIQTSLLSAIRGLEFYRHPMTSIVNEKHQRFGYTENQAINHDNLISENAIEEPSSTTPMFYNRRCIKP